MNGGLRWEPFFGQNVRNNAISNFDLENFRWRPWYHRIGEWAADQMTRLL